jgi:hypothetical protein
MGIFVLSSIWLVVFLTRWSEDPNASLSSQDRTVLLFVSMGVLALLALIAGEHRRWAYYVASAVLAAWLLRGLYVCLWNFHVLLSGRSASEAYYHAFQKSQPLVTRVHIFHPGLRVLVILCNMCLLTWLSVRFTFGRPSRKYFGFQDAENCPPQSSAPSPNL